MRRITPGILTADNADALNQAITKIEAILEPIASGSQVIPFRENGGFACGDLTEFSYMNIPFDAELTSVSGIFYAWREVYRTSTTAWATLEGGRSGTTSVTPAIENQGNTATVGTIVQLRRKFLDNTYDWVYGFDAPIAGDNVTVLGPTEFTSIIEFNDNDVTVNTTQNNYDVTNKTVIQFNPTTNVNITGFIPYDPTKAQMIVVQNNNPTYNLTLVYNSGSSTANYRIYTPGGGDIVLPSYTSAILIYSPVDLRWIVVCFSPRAYTITAVSTGYTINFGTSVSLSVSPPGILSLPVLTITGTPTWTPTAGQYPILWNQFDKVLWIWDGAAWQSISVGFTNPMTTAGDIIYGGASGVATRLPANGLNKLAVLAQQSAVSTIPVWSYLNVPVLEETSSKTVGNTTTETTLLNTLPTIYPNEPQVGSSYRVTLWGYQSFDGAVDTIQFKAYISSTAILDSGAITTPGPTTTKGWKLELEFTFRAVGVSGTVFAQGLLFLSDGANVSTVIHIPSTATTTIDTTASQNINVKVTWSNALATNTITMTNALIEQIF